ncbi:MAG: hypothetical protein LBI79_03485 [Nitrososphaerota archaeon]|jgi:hypothetical protein|nr:hypothetical protein [Nitrososphaerota archaeon]
MNSLTLKENGFVDFRPLKGLQLSNIPENTNSVIIIADTTLIDKSKSDILYIGKTKKLAKRIFGGYLAGYGSKTTQKIHATLFNEGYIEKAAISWILTDDPKATQQELLEKYKNEHDNYPAWNVVKKIDTKPQKNTKKAAKPQKNTKKTKTPVIAKTVKKVIKKRKPSRQNYKKTT